MFVAGFRLEAVSTDGRRLIEPWEPDFHVDSVAVSRDGRIFTQSDDKVKALAFDKVCLFCFVANFLFQMQALIDSGNSILRLVGMDTVSVKEQLQLLEPVLVLNKQLFLRCGAVTAKERVCEVATNSFRETLHRLHEQKMTIRHRSVLEWLLKALQLLHNHSVVRSHFSAVTVVQAADEKTILGFPNLATVEIVKDSKRLTEGWCCFASMLIPVQQCERTFETLLASCVLWAQKRRKTTKSTLFSK